MKFHSLEQALKMLFYLKFDMPFGTCRIVDSVFPTLLIKFVK